MSDLLKHVKVISQKTEVNPYLLAGLTNQTTCLFCNRTPYICGLFCNQTPYNWGKSKNQQSPITAETNGHHDLN
jgi:hypothetical protein